PSRRQTWLRPAEITAWGRSENSTGMGVTSRKLRPANGPGFLPDSRAGRTRTPSSACPRGRADMVTRCRASHTAGSGARATREWQIRYRGFGITSSRSMTSSLLHSVPNACTVQPKARPASDAVTVAGSGLIRTPSLRGTRRTGDADPAGAPDHRVRRLPHLDLALGTRHRAGGRSRSAAG